MANADERNFAVIGLCALGLIFAAVGAFAPVYNVATEVLGFVNPEEQLDFWEVIDLLHLVDPENEPLIKGAAAFSVLAFILSVASTAAAVVPLKKIVLVGLLLLQAFCALLGIALTGATKSATGDIEVAGVLFTSKFGAAFIVAIIHLIYVLALIVIIQLDKVPFKNAGTRTDQPQAKKTEEGQAGTNEGSSAEEVKEVVKN